MATPAGAEAGGMPAVEAMAMGTGEVVGAALEEAMATGTVEAAGATVVEAAAAAATRGALWDAVAAASEGARRVAAAKATVQLVVDSSSRRGRDVGLQVAHLKSNHAHPQLRTTWCTLHGRHTIQVYQA